MTRSSIFGCSTLAACMAFMVPVLTAQNSIRVFAPVDVQGSAQGTGYGADAVAFNSSTLNLTCPASPTAVLSSSADGTGNVLVDNYINVTTTSGTTITGPTNVCHGGLSNDCFTAGYQTPASKGQLDGQDPDNFAATGGVAPIDVSSKLQTGTMQLKVDLMDTGGDLASSTIYLDTNCTLNGVTGPAGISGNPISQTNPTPQQLTQNFAFDATSNQQVQFVYDLSQAQAAGTLSITPDTLPGTTDLPVDPNGWQTTWVPGTSFATSICLIHTGELLNNAPACKLYTLECSVGTGANSSGAQCPISSLPNEVFKDVFDGPGFTLPDINVPNGPTFHEGVGFLMASEGWTGRPCTFDIASGLENLPCPQNLLSNFSGPGVYTASGQTSHPNSTFIPIAQVPEDLTTVTVAGETAGGWINKSSATVTLSSQPPVLTGTNLPGAAGFVASPIQSITYGISAPNAVPVPGTPPTTDTVADNSSACPGPPAAVFATQQTFSNLGGRQLSAALFCAGLRGNRGAEIYAGPEQELVDLLLHGSDQCRYDCAGSGFGAGAYSGSGTVGQLHSGGEGHGDV